MKLLDPEKVARAIDWPVENWPGRCYGVAHAMLVHGVADGKLRYGHWLGPVHPLSQFAGKPIIPHGWIEQPGDMIIDPTRWVFEAVAPYIYCGPNGGLYDMGGDMLRAELEQPCPPPEGKPVTLAGLDDGAALYVRTITGKPVSDLQFSHVFWLANLSRAALGEHLVPIYRAIEGAGLQVLIPIDNYQFYRELVEA